MLRNSRPPFTRFIKQGVAALEKHIDYFEISIQFIKYKNYNYKFFSLKETRDSKSNILAEMRGGFTYDKVSHFMKRQVRATGDGGPL